MKVVLTSGEMVVVEGKVCLVCRVKTNTFFKRALQNSHLIVHCSLFSIVLLAFLPRALRARVWFPSNQWQERISIYSLSAFIFMSFNEIFRARESSSSGTRKVEHEDSNFSQPQRDSAAGSSYELEKCLS